MTHIFFLLPINVIQRERRNVDAQLNVFIPPQLFADYSKKGISGADNVHKIHGKMIKKKQESLQPDPKFNEGLIISEEKAIKTDLSKIYEEKEKFKNKNVEIQGDVIQVSNKVKGSFSSRISLSSLK